MNIIFQNRRDAGRLLGKKLRSLGMQEYPLILALPRGGVPVGFETALQLDSPLEVFVVRKLGAPGHEELAMGAIATGGFRVLNEDVVQALGIPPGVVDAVALQEERELHRREQYYRGDYPAATLKEAVVILVDDGIATGATMSVAVEAVKHLGAGNVLVASPVASREAMRKLLKIADDVVALSVPEPFHSVAQWYQNFSQTTDDEVCEFLRMAHEKQLTHP